MMVEFNRSIRYYYCRNSNKMAIANVRTIFRWRMLEQNCAYLWSYTIAVVVINVMYSNKMSYIRTKCRTFEQNVVHSNKMSYIRTKCCTFEQNVVHSNKMSNVQTKYPTFKQNVLHSNKMSCIWTKCPTFEQMVGHHTLKVFGCTPHATS
jgi:hypothetical protein